jgi:hypothetical protein
MDFANAEQRLLGYRTLNLLNVSGDGIDHSLCRSGFVSGSHDTGT